MINNKRIYKIAFILYFFFIPSIVQAQTWINASMENNKTVFIDIDSVTSNNNSIYYNVKYYGQNGEEISTVQSQGYNAGIISTYKLSEYNNKKRLNTLTNDNSNLLSDISVKSFLYNANEIAKFTNFRKTHISNKIVSSNTKNEKYKNSLNDEYKTSLTRPFSANTGKIDISKDNQLVMFSKPYNTTSEKIETGELAKSFDIYQNKLYQEWAKLIKRGSTSKKAVVLITFYKNGELVSCILRKSSGDDKADDAAIKAVRQVGNFGELPKDYKDDYLDINFTFSYRGITIN